MPKKEPGKDVAAKASTDVALPQDWQTQLSNEAKDSAASVRPVSSSIRLRAGIVTYQDVQAPDNKLDVVVIGFAQEHTYYEGKYDADNPSNPDCFAIAKRDVELEDITPSSAVPEPQSEFCASCPQLKWGSSQSGGRGKACQQRYRLICVPASACNSAEDMLAAEVATLKLPVTSGKVWGQYIQTVASLHNRPEWSVVTTISAKPDAKTQFKAVFTVESIIDFESTPEMFNAIKKKQEMAMPVLLQGYDMSSRAEESAPEKGKKYGK